MKPPGGTLRRVTSPGRGTLAVVSVLLVLAGLLTVRTIAHLGGTRAAGASVPTAGGLSVFVGYAEDKEIETPDPAQFPVPWAGAPNTTFLGGTYPGQTACGMLTTCYDAGAIRLDNPGPAAITVDSVSVDDHSSVPGGTVFDNLWGSFTVPPGQSTILTENPPGDNPSYDNFDTSSFPPSCTPLAVAPTVTVTVGGVPTTLVDSTHVLDTGGTDAGSCAPAHNESIQWRAIGEPGTDSASLTLGPPTMTAFTGQPATETATLLDGSGNGIPNATVDFTVTSGPDAGTIGTSVTDSSGVASFTYSGQQGEDVLVASVSTVGTFQSNTARVMWTNDSAAGWTGTDIGGPTPAGGQSLDPSNGTWSVAGAGTGIGGPADQFHLLWQPIAAGDGVAARLTSFTGAGPAGQAGVMLRSSTDPGAPYYAALADGNQVLVQDRSAPGGPSTTVVVAQAATPAYLWVASSGPSITTYSSSDGFNWSPIAGSAVPLSLGPSPLGGLAVTSANPGALATGTFDQLAVSGALPAPQPPVSCPSPFNCADIGGPSPAGSQSFDPNSGTWTINAGGTDITGASDQFHFVWQTVTGDGSISAHVTSQSNSSSNAKAGVMLRATTDPGSPEYSVLVSPGAGIKVQVRSTQGGTTTKLANPTGTVPAYLEVTRAGNTFTASTSPDGVTWTPIAGSSFTMNPGPTLLGGLAVTSHHSGVLGTVTMDTVDIT